ncbi:hypothetical protein EB061_04645, partial [bacterium]|nr:hypothetical protein [bacterium]
SGSGEQDTCDEAKMKVVQLLLKGENSQIFAKMVELTELKMVLLLSSSSDSKDKTGDSRTLEGWLKSKNEYFSKAKENDFKDQLSTLYTSFGRSVDQDKIDKVIAKISEGKQEYWKARLDNESASAMLLYLSKYNILGAPKIEASDAATIWALQKIRENNGTHSVNQKKAVQQGKLNFTTRVCQKLGSPKCLGQAETFVLNESKIKEMQNTREERENELTKAIEAAVRTIKDDQKYLDCFMKCNTDEKWPAMIQDVKFKLAAFIAKGDAQVGSETLEIDPTKTIGFDEKGNENLTLFFNQK